jgi:hypothetical protein
VEDRDKVFSNLKRKTFISRIVQTWLGAPKGRGGGLRPITNYRIKHGFNRHVLTFVHPIVWRYGCAGCFC